MNTPSASMRVRAERLLAIEAAGPSASESHMDVAARVAEKLRISLTRFVGADGFRALQTRALALARSEVPSLQAVKVTADGRLEGIEAAGKDGEAANAITSHLLGLLSTFIGESLTLRLLRHAWPEASLEE